VSPEPTAWVGPAFVDADHAFARIHGATNTLELTGPDGETVTFTGPGAGPETTAATILDDVVEIQSAAPRRACHAPVGNHLKPAAPSGQWFVAFETGSLALKNLADYLSFRGLAIRRLESVGTSAAVLTWPISGEAVRLAIEPLHGLGVRALVVPVIGAGANG
jgi:hypothetical protein